MAGHVAVRQNRVRIKGRTWSVLRFFSISVAYTIVWILLTSRLGYYSNLFGPQILLKLNIAFYLPSIPILILSGRVETAMDAKLGQAMSMKLRLGAGILGCFLVCSSFPMYPESEWVLMFVSVALGTVASIAFSTSYQLVSWFRSADTIALGLGCVGSGPIVLLMELFLAIGPHSARWQIIALFELAAVIVALGLASLLSLFAQYWDILAGDEDHQGAQQRLLSPDNDQAYPVLTGRPSLPSSTPMFFVAPDPYHGLFVPLSHEASQPWNGDDDDCQPPLLRSYSDDHSHHNGAWPRRGKRGLSSLPVFHSFQNHSVLSKLKGPTPFRGRGRDQVKQEAMVYQQPTRPNLQHRSSLESFKDKQESTNPASTGSAFEALGPASTVLAACIAPEGDQLQGNPEVATQNLSEHDQAPSPPSLLAETVEAMQGIWPIWLSVLVSVTVLNVAFPLFTYVPTSGLLGESLPMVLFFTRIFADILGRLIPRVKAIATQNATVLLVLSGAMALVGGLLMAYITTPDFLHNDLFPFGAIVFLWMTGGYINTCANLMAPNAVEPRLVPRASSLIALCFQLAHFTGLIIAVALAIWLFGSIAGEL